MRRTIRALAVLLTLGSAVSESARADQKDPRLERLFERLQEAESVAEAKPIEQRIWRVWHQSSDVFVNRLMERGSGAMERRDLERALEHFDLMVTWAPEFAEGWNRRATVHYMLGNYDQSVRDIQRVLALEPRHFGALSGLGVIYQAIEQPRAALRSFEAALEIHPHLEGTRERVDELQRRLEGRAT